MNEWQISKAQSAPITTAMLARAAFASVCALNVSFLRFCPGSCLSGHDNFSVVWKVQGVC